MKNKFKIINLFIPLIVVFAILFPVLHSYEHIQSHNASHKSVKQLYHSDRSEFKAHDHSTDECAICHFKFSPIGAFSFITFQFYKNSTIIHSVPFYTKSLSEFFKGSLFSLRAPPIFRS